MTSTPTKEHRFITRSYSGCWTCRLRRKKCDEQYPVCRACANLTITCHYDPEKPAWMDGGARQEEMAEQIKRDVRVKNRRLRGNREPGPGVNDEHVTDHADAVPPSNAVVVERPELAHVEPTASFSNIPASESQPASGCKVATKDVGRSIAVGRRDAFLFTYYLDYVLPLLFAFYCPPLLDGGRAWILQMMITSPVVRQVTLCQSSYFFLLSQDGTRDSASSGMVLSHSREAFRVLREALQVINDSSLAEHLNGAVRILASIMQVQRFDVAVSNFDYCQAHLNAALALFQRLLAAFDDGQSATTVAARFLAIIDTLGYPAGPPEEAFPHLPSAEQDGLRFSAALLIFDDIIASTMHQEQPVLSSLHEGLLSAKDGKGPHIDLVQVVGCENWPMLQIGRIATLNAWKQRQSRAGSLDMLELVRCSENIKDAIQSHLLEHSAGSDSIPWNGGSLVDILGAERGAPGAHVPGQSSVVTKVWGIAALLYLSTVVSGCQPGNDQIRRNVDAILGILTNEISPPSLLRTVVWPFCVAGCLAEKRLECHFRQLADPLRPTGIFGTVQKALEIMERAWRDRESSETSVWGLATYFHNESELVLLV